MYSFPFSGKMMNTNQNQIQGRIRTVQLFQRCWIGMNYPISTFFWNYYRSFYWSPTNNQILRIDLTLCTPENPAPHESTTVCMLQCSGALLHRKLSLWNLKRACTQNQNCDSDKNEIGKTIAKHLGLEFRLTRF